MAVLASAIQWIINLSEGERYVAKRFSLSPTATEAKGQQQSDGPGSVLDRRKRSLQGTTGQSASAPPAAQQEEQKRPHLLPDVLSQQVRYLQFLLHYPRNTDIGFSTHYTRDGRECVMVYSNVSVNQANLEDNLLRPLRQISGVDYDPQAIAKQLPCTHYRLESRVQELANAVVEGNVVLLVGGGSNALVYTYTDFPSRAVSTPVNETVLRGAQEAFTESLETNIAMLRRVVRCPDVVIEVVTLKDPARTRLAICSVATVTNDRLLAEVYRRIEQIGPIPMNASGLIEQHLEDHWRSLFPTMLYTERPDLAGRYLTQGHVLVMIDNMPLLILAPATFWMQFTTAEDMNLRIWYANFVRVIRGLSVLLSLFLPAVYIALTNFQQEMIPSDILMAMAGARQNMPYPTILEVLILEFAFELIREASIRVPHVIGSTIGIVGALILGQSAVEANLVSPVVVIVISLTGLGSFAIPNQSVGFSLRILRYLFTGISFLFGFFGIALMGSLLIVYLTSMQSFGVPYMTPIAPFRRKEEGFFRHTVLGYDTKPVSIHPKDVTNSQMEADSFGNQGDETS